VPGAKYDGKDFTPVKDEIRDRLLEDQFALCCYCMCRISKESRPHPTKPDAPAVVQMKVEHWQSQEEFEERQLDWANILGACLGNEGAPKAAQTCDSRKGKERITLSPLDEAHVRTLRCKSSGELESTDARFQADIDERLGLNVTTLVNERKTQLDRALHKLKAQYPKASIPKTAVRALIDELETPTSKRLPPFGSVLRLWAGRRYDSW
jgi:uncharacterized protein (TIGR02646 family)